MPLGFIPYHRYPLPGVQHCDTYIFYGPWQVLVDRLLAEGSGAWAWESLCRAAAVEVGEEPTEGKGLVRHCQAHLHRLGHNCGPIDGVVTEDVLVGLNAFGVGQLPLGQAAAILAAAPTPVAPISTGEVREGHLHLPGMQVTAAAFGSLAVARAGQGYTLYARGAGRVILDVQGIER